ncbi:MAG: hypothetical protein GY821_09430 [Gammaproteobacteria bacterium]|nr:hypothetical protein [Gammaproteobacteria bacterium]
MSFYQDRQQHTIMATLFDDTEKFMLLIATLDDLCLLLNALDETGQQALFKRITSNAITLQHYIKNSHDKNRLRQAYKGNKHYLPKSLTRAVQKNAARSCAVSPQDAHNNSWCGLFHFTIKRKTKAHNNQSYKTVELVQIAGNAVS